MEPVVKLGEQTKTMDEEIGNLAQQLGETQAALQSVQKDMQAMKALFEANDVSKLQGAIATLKTSVEGVSVFTRDVQEMRTKLVGLEKDMQVLKKDVDSQWSAIDSIGAGALKGK
jgi:uncharacterized protein YPO0396